MAKSPNKFVVIFRRSSRIRPGVHEKRVSFSADDPNLAFVHFSDERALQVSTHDVFDTLAEAEKCFAAGGVDRWVILLQHHNLIPLRLFTKVNTYVSSWGKLHTVLAAAPESSRISIYGAYSTEKECNVEYKKLLKRAEAYLRESSAELEESKRKLEAAKVVFRARGKHVDRSNNSNSQNCAESPNRD